MAQYSVLTCLRSLTHYCIQNLKPGALTPFNAFADCQRFVSSLAYSETSAPSISVSDDALRFSYKDKCVEIPQLIQGIRKLFEDTVQDVNNLFQNHSIPINIPAIVPDDMTNTTRGYSWLNNGCFAEPFALMRILCDDKSLRLCQKDPSGGLIWNTSAVVTTLQKCKKINKGLSVLCHTATGQPCRAKEFVDLKYRNGTRPRGLFREFNNLLIVPRRLKTETTTGREVFIPRYVPPELQALLEQYLIIVRPVEEQLAYQAYGEEERNLYEEYVWVQMGRVISGEDFSDCLEEYTERYIGCALSIQPWRHMAISWTREYLGDEMQLEKEKEKGEHEDVLAAQTGHSEVIRQLRYAPEISKLSSLTSDTMHRFKAASEAWWRFMQFYPGAQPVLPLRTHRRLEYEVTQGAHPTTVSLPSTVSSGPQATLSDAALDNFFARVQAVQSTSVAHIQNDLNAQISGLRHDLKQAVTVAVGQGIADYIVRQGTQSRAQIAPSPHEMSGAAFLPIQMEVEPEVILPVRDDMDDLYLSEAPAVADPPFSPTPLIAHPPSSTLR